MTAAQMEAAVHVLLDEVTVPLATGTSFWTDEEVFASLADGQNAAIGALWADYNAKRKANPKTLLSDELNAVQFRTTADSLAANIVNAPAGYLHLINAAWDHDDTGGMKACLVVTQDERIFEEDNEFLAATPDMPTVAIGNPSGTTLFSFRPVYSTSAEYQLDYIKTPTDIASGQNATLPVSTHNAIVFYAVSRLLQKDSPNGERAQEIGYYMNLFNQEIGKTL
jgi:hypothetical protein